MKFPLRLLTKSIQVLVIGLLALHQSVSAQGREIVPVMQDAWVKESHGGMVEDAKARADKIKIVFLGDSITARWTSSPGQKIWAEYYAPIGAINLGIPADATQHVLWRLQNGVLDPLHPKMLILLIGTNNIPRGEPDAIAYGVWTIVDFIRKKLPDTRVLVQGVFPREDKPEYNAKIAKLNEYLAKLDDGKMVKYIYFGDKFLGSDGKLFPAIFNDKLHPNFPEGFDIWQANIKPIVEEWLKLEPIANVPPPPAPVPTPNDLSPSTAEPRNDWLFRHNRILSTPVAAKEKCKLLFLGDEVMGVFSERTREVFNKEYSQYGALNFAIWGNRPENIYWQVENGALENINPKLVVVQTQWAVYENKITPEDISAYMSAITKTIRRKLPETKILLLGAFPMGEKPNDPLREKIKKYNELLSKVADNQNIHFLDIGSGFLAPDGSAPKGSIPSHQQTDVKAFEKWAELQRDTIAKLVAP